jgi:hypothetical protein
VGPKSQALTMSDSTQSGRSLPIGRPSLRHQPSAEISFVQLNRVARNVSSNDNYGIDLRKILLPQKLCSAAYVAAALKLRNRLPFVRLKLLLEKQGVPGALIV